MERSSVFVAKLMSPRSCDAVMWFNTPTEATLQPKVLAATLETESPTTLKHLAALLNWHTWKIIMNWIRPGSDRRLKSDFSVHMILADPIFWSPHDKTSYEIWPFHKDSTHIYTWFQIWFRSDKQLSFLESNWDFLDIFFLILDIRMWS